MSYYGYTAERCDAFFDYIPDAPTINPLVAPTQLLAVPDSALDNAITLRIYGTDAGGRAILDPTDGNLGFVVTANTVPTLAAPVIARIERVSKDVSKGFVKLYAGSVNGTLLGDYEPDELEPMYRRIRTSRRCASLRIAYRKRDRNITSLTDVINLRSKPAIINAVMALSIRLTDPERAQALLAQARGWLQDEQAQRDQSMPPREPEHVGQMDCQQDYSGFY